MEILTEYLSKGFMTMLAISMPCVLTAAAIGLVVGILQAVITTALVDVALISLHFMFPSLISIPSAITLGAIAAATAPAAPGRKGTISGSASAASG